MTSPMVLKAARALSDRSAELCDVDWDEQWKLHSAHFIDNAQAALDAVGAEEMREVLNQWAGHMALAGIEPDDDSPNPLESLLARTRAALAKVQP